MQRRFQSSGYLKFERMERKRENGGKLWILSKIMKTDQFGRYARTYWNKKKRTVRLLDWDRCRILINTEANKADSWFLENWRDVVKKEGSSPLKNNLQKLEDGEMRFEKFIEKVKSIYPFWFRHHEGRINEYYLMSRVDMILRELKFHLPSSYNPVMQEFTTKEGGMKELLDFRIAEIAMFLIKSELKNQGISTKAV